MIIDLQWLSIRIWGRFERLTLSSRPGVVGPRLGCAVEVCDLVMYDLRRGAAVGLDAMDLHGRNFGPAEINGEPVRSVAFRIVTFPKPRLLVTWALPPRVFDPQG